MLKGVSGQGQNMEGEAGHVLKAGLEVEPAARTGDTMGDQSQEQWEGLVVGEAGQRIMEHQVAVEGTLGEAAVPMKAKPEGEGVHIVLVRVVLV